MLDESVLLFSAWLKDTNGVNVILATLPRKKIDGTDQDAPPLVTVVNDVEDASVAASLSPDSVPALMLWGDSDAEVNVAKYPTAREVVVAAAFVTDDSADPLTSITNCGYVLRAARLSMMRYRSQRISADFRELNGIKVVDVSSVKEHRVSATVGRRKMWGFLDIRATVVETLS